MKTAPFRIIAGLLLVIALLTLSGVTSATAAFADAHTAASCCDSDCDTTPDKGPCSTPDCPCFSCVSMIVAKPLMVQRDCQGERLTYPSAAHFHLFHYAPAIEYPPETV